MGELWNPFIAVTNFHKLFNKCGSGRITGTQTSSVAFLSQREQTSGQKNATSG